MKNINEQLKLTKNELSSGSGEFSDTKIKERDTKSTDEIIKKIKDINNDITLTSEVKIEKLGSLLENLKAQESLWQELSEEEKNIYKSLNPGERKEYLNLEPDKAERIMGKENFLGLEAIKATFDFTPNIKDIPKIPFDEKTLKRAKELNQYLVLRINTTSGKEPLTMEKMNELKGGKTKDEGKIFYSSIADGKLKDDTWYKNEDLYTKETPTMGWALVSKEVIPNSTSKNYLNQTETIVNYIKNEVFKDKKVDRIYQEAIDEFNKKKDNIKELMTSDWKKASEQLANLKITQLTRQNPAEVVYDILLMKEKNDKYILSGIYTWTKSRLSDGWLVFVGNAAYNGSDVYSLTPVSSHSSLGVSVSRRR